MFRTDNKNASLFFARLALGIVMFPHGAQKALGWFGGAGMQKTLDVFTTKMNFPVWLAALVIAIEFLGSLGLIAGFMTRLAAFGIGASLSVCAYLNHLQHGFFMNWFGQQKGEGFEFHILAVGLALALVIGGGGGLSVDGMIMKKGRK